MLLVNSNNMSARQQKAETLLDYWEPELVRKAGEIAIKAPRERMENIMVEATAFMEQLPWKGVTTVRGQNLAWPRAGVKLKDGSIIPDTEIPESVKECTIKVSYFIAAGIPFDIPALTHVILTIGHLLVPSASVKKADLISW